MRTNLSPVPLAVSILMIASGTTFAQPVLEKAMGAMSQQLELPDGTFATLHSVGDFNRDEELDLLLFDFTNEHAWIMLGDGAGDFDSHGPFIVDRTFAIVAGQFDADPEPEIAFREFGFGYYISFNPDEDPVEIEDAEIVYFGTSSTSDAFAPMIRGADIDGDGLDEIVLNTDSERVFIRWSSTGATSPILLDGLGEENALYVADDYDGDGDLDLLLFSVDSAHFWLVEGDGSGALVSREILRDYPSIANDERPSFGHLDPNPAIDMVVVDSTDQSMRIEFNFLTPEITVQPILADEFVLPLEVVGDLDDSGEPDLVVMRLNQFDPAASADFIPGVLFDPVGSSPTVADLDAGMPQRDTPYFQGFVNGVPLTSVTGFDVDQDGDEDLLWHGFSGPDANSVWAIENRLGVPGVPQIGMPSFDATLGTLNLLAIDLDQDGFDEAIVTSSGRMRILDLQDGTISNELNASSNAWMAVEADIDADGSSEVVAGNLSVNHLRIWPVTNTGTLGERIIIPTGAQGVTYYGLEVADLNNDGYDDIAAKPLNGAPHIYFGGPGPSLTFGGSPAVVNPAGVKDAVLDFNKDGLQDLAIGSASPIGISLYSNNGDGTFSQGPVLESDQSLREPYWVTSGDIDLDGIVDIVFSDNFGGNVVVMFLNADGTLDEFRTIVAGQIVEVFIDDLNGDGLPDLAVAANSNGFGVAQPGVIPQHPNRSFGPLVTLPALDSQSVALTDINQDGAMDMISVSASERKVRAFFASLPPCPADLNGDGTLNFFDVSQFLVNQPDYNSDGVFNFFDVAAFIVDFSNGCP